MIAVGISDIGLVRKKNEDSFLIDKERGLFIVCDGMGGHKGGDVASKLAIDILNKNIAFQSVDEAVISLNKTIELTNQVIWKKGQDIPELKDMGTTVTAAIIKDNKLIVASVGDSSLFLLSPNQINKVTRDHTLAEQMVRDGLLRHDDLSNNPYNHILTRAVGVDKNILVDIFTQEISPGQTVLICTDGLTSLVDEQEILFQVSQYDNIETSAQELIKLALARGGHDNITVVLARM